MSLAGKRFLAVHGTRTAYVDSAPDRRSSSSPDAIGQALRAFVTSLAASLAH